MPGRALHRESQFRQRSFQQRAADLGWPAERITVIDEDLAQSATKRYRDRTGFQNILVAARQTRNRQVDIAHELRSRNRNRNAGRRAEELAQQLDDHNDWAKNYRSFHLGDKLIAMAVRFPNSTDDRSLNSKPFERVTLREAQARAKRKPGRAQP